MRALVVDHTVTAHLSLAEVAGPVPAPREALIRVGAVSLHVLRRMGQLLGRRVMITGASGGVGRYAVQLAARAGAEVVAISGNPAQEPSLRALGAHEVHADPAKVDRAVFAVLDNVGGRQLEDAFGALQAGGMLVSVGRSSEEDAVLPPDAFLATEGRHDRSIRTFFLFGDPATDFSADLTWLAAEVAAGRLDPGISWRGPWTRYAEAAQALLDRRLHGKAVLDIN